jgi:hypothetical protein
MAKTSKYSILIICEGEKTEPQFFDSIRDAVINGIYYIGDVRIKIKPEPEEDEEDKEEVNVQSEHKAIREKRQTRKATVGDEPDQEKIPLPLKWVREGQIELEEGTYNEVWTVFDHDNHPARKEAFDEADKIINGSKVHIAFSSHCFEYYLLLHFEKVYKQFKTSECRDKNNDNAAKRKKPIDCGTDKHKDDCHGVLCIGGYARLKNYWINSKDDNSTFELIKETIEIGFENSAWLRYISDLKENEKQFYDRNPYITTDSIVKRLTGNEHRSWRWVSIDEEFPIDELIVKISSEKKIFIHNINKSKSVLIQPNAICKVSLSNNRMNFGSQLLIYPSKIVAIDLSGYILQNDDSWFVFHYKFNNVMFSFSQNNYSF